jgi:hypothetical protein
MQFQFLASAGKIRREMKNRPLACAGTILPI